MMKYTGTGVVLIIHFSYPIRVIGLSSRLVTSVISIIIHLLVEMKSESGMMCADVRNGLADASPNF